MHAISQISRSNSGELTLQLALNPPPLHTFAALYNVLNITGWSSYPDCWIFPQPAITLVYEDATYQIATTADEEDKTKGKLVANAWCQ